MQTLACVLALLVLSCHASLVLGSQRLRVSPRVAALAANLTLAQKIGFLHGYDGPYVGTIAGLASAGIPPLTMEDGPQGVADGVVHTTAWPSALTVAQTWNPELFAFFASQCAEEQRARGTGVMLGPMVNLARVPQGGRNFESLGEDPFLSSRLVEASIKGIQSQHVMANVKHFIDNNQETNRTTISASIDMATQYDLYLQPFRAAVNAGVLSVMCSYNKINGDWACENEQTIQLLKQLLGFQYFLVSDWGATHSTVKAALAGLDVEMPGADFFGATLLQAVQNGSVPEALIDDKVQRVLGAMEAIGFLDSPPQGNLSVSTRSPARDLHARNLAAASAVLLRNEANTLPIVLPSTGPFVIGVIGDFGNLTSLVSGGGSGHVNADSVVTAWSGIVQQLQSWTNKEVQVLYARTDTAAATAVAQASNVAVVVVAAYSSEGSDRSTLALDAASDALVVTVAKYCNRTAVVINGPGAVLTPWRDMVGAIINMGYPGQAFGNALSDILFGKHNPSGRLAVSWPKSDTEVLPTTAQWPGVDGIAQYTERMLIGYRWYNAHGKDPHYPFGHGLSYSGEFEYLNFTCTTLATGVACSCTVTNPSTLTGVEVVQLYVSFPERYLQPVFQLKGFSAVTVTAGATVPVSFFIDFARGDLDLWDEASAQPVRAHGHFLAVFGASATDSRGAVPFKVPKQGE